MSKPRFSILHTSARPDKWRAIYDAWLSNCDRPEDVEYILVVDERWGFEKSLDNYTLHHRWCDDRVVWNNGRRCYVEGVNLAAKHATGDILIVVADDQFPCEHWDTYIDANLRRERCEEPEAQFVLAVSTGTPDEFERGIVVMPIMSRALYENWGYVFYPEYESMYADNDLCEHAKQDGVLIEARHLMFPHKHPFAKEPQPPISFADLQKWDEAYQAQNRPEAYVLGERLLKARRANKFGSLLSSARAKPGQKIAVCLPGEFFHHTWVNALLHLYQFLNRRFQHVSIFTAYTSAAYVTRAGLLKKMQEHGVDFDYVLWIDDDNILQPEQLALLLEDLEEHPELSGIAGWCWCQEGEGEMHLSAGIFNADGSCERFDVNALLQGPHDLWPVGWTGFPVFLQRWEVFEKIGPRPFTPIPTSHHFYGAFGEDVSFCKRALEAGLSFAIDRRVKVPHLKIRQAGPPQFLAIKPALDGDSWAGNAPAKPGPPLDTELTQEFLSSFV